MQDSNTHTVQHNNTHEIITQYTKDQPQLGLLQLLQCNIPILSFVAYSFRSSFPYILCNVFQVLFSSILTSAPERKKKYCYEIQRSNGQSVRNTTADLRTCREVGGEKLGECREVQGQLAEASEEDLGSKGAVVPMMMMMMMIVTSFFIFCILSPPVPPPLFFVIFTYLTL
jgi:hypothetical protein